jgi:putative transposase
MSRKPRIHFKGALYHAVARGNGQREIFLNDEDYQSYMGLLKAYKQRYKFRLYAYALLPDRLHLLIEVDRAPLSRIMQGLQFRHSRRINQKHGRSGHLFGDRYHAVICQKSVYLAALTAHLHLAPVRAGLAKHAADFPWTSFHAYAGISQPTGLVATQPVLDWLAKRADGPQSYAEYVTEQAQGEDGQGFYRVTEGQFLGSPAFVKQVNALKTNQSAEKRDIFLADIVASTSRALGIPEDLFYSPSRNHQGAWGRSVAGYLARKLCNCQVKVVADHFQRHPAVISQGMGKVERRLREEALVMQAIQTIEAELTPRLHKQHGK